MANTASNFDVFISYSSKDKVLVRAKLLAPLEAAGLSAVIDYRDFEYGAPPLDNMRTAIRKSRHTLLAITERWLQSEWCEFESLFAEHLDPTGKRRKIIPVKLDESHPPSELLRTWCDLSNERVCSTNLAKLIAQLLVNKMSQGLPSSEPTVNLPVADRAYEKLRDLLSLRQWKEADIETREILCRAVGASPISGLKAEAMVTLPLATLQVVDRYWSQVSGGKFGFAAQHRVFEDCQRDWERFGRHVGWIRNGLWVAYTDVWQHAVHDDLREGELPVGGRGGFWAGIGDVSLGNGIVGFLKCQYKILEAGLGDLFHTGGFNRVGQRFIDDVTLNNGFALAWMKPRELLLDRWKEGKLAGHTSIQEQKEQKQAQKGSHLD